MDALYNAALSYGPAGMFAAAILFGLRWFALNVLLPDRAALREVSERLIVTLEAVNDRSQATIDVMHDAIAASDARYQKAQSESGALFAEQTKILGEQSNLLGEQTQLLSEQGELLAAQNKFLAEQSQTHKQQTAALKEVAALLVTLKGRMP